MSLRLYLLGIGISTASALVLWFWVLWTVDPWSATRFEYTLFFISLFIWLMGLVSLAGFYWRLMKSHNEFYYGNLLISLRQAFFFSLLISASLCLWTFHLVSISEIILLVIATVLFESYFLAKK